MWKEFYKDGKVYTFEMNRFYSGVQDREQKLIDEGYTAVFDKRTLTFNNGRSGSVILENAHFSPESILQFQQEVYKSGFPKSVCKQFYNLHPEHMKELKRLIENREVKNVLIDSLLEDREQFRYVIKHCLCWFAGINIFVSSHGKLIEILKDEVANHMDKHDIRNSYYTCGPNDTQYFNDLTFTIIKNNVYEMDGDIMSRIKFKASYEGLEVFYQGAYKFMTEYYKSIDDDVLPTEKKSKWA